MPGVVLEGAVQWDGYYLVFTTDDVPFEEFLRVNLLDGSLAVVDGARIGNIYSTGAFSDLRVLGENCLTFEFIGDTTWEIEFLSKPSLRYPWSEPWGVWRGLGLRRHFIVRGDPRPDV